MTIETIWAQYQSSIQAFLHSKISNPADVEDLLQEILFKSYLHLDEIRDSTKVKSWLFQIANHAIIDFYRRQAKGKNLNTESLWPEQEIDQTRQALTRCLQPFIKGLPAEQAAMLTAIELEGTSQKAYAEQLNIPYSTLKTRLQKARQSLNTLFHQCCQFERDQQGTVMDYTPHPKASCPAHKKSSQ
ncbi:ECF RNA polymerase sigma factor SigM [Vibrio stylophorae]|uniref:RNA polymerase sigma factor SigZ n=1 Tax=Vibrio stylophorae TaxID=659351 RepID=A0ABN8DWU9_9VIBR|nr:RNA polymerase sigma factor SigZ [Vibrio stylophorae]CAH0535797.1 ECF RNA polymerase sigma factor SigM [Vibrio stylophorae]